MEEKQSYLTEDSLGKLMRKYAIPCIISLLVGALYNIVDQIFIANAQNLGSYGNAANTVVFPLTVLASAVLTAVYLLFGTTLVTLFGGRAACRKSDWAYASRKHEQRQQKGEYAR